MIVRTFFSGLILLQACVLTQSQEERVNKVILNTLHSPSPNLIQKNVFKKLQQFQLTPNQVDYALSNLKIEEGKLFKDLYIIPKHGVIISEKLSELSLPSIKSSDHCVDCNRVQYFLVRLYLNPTCGSKLCLEL